MFYFAEDQEIFKGENPAKRVKLHEEHSRERYVTVEEMPRFLAALQTEKNPDLKDFIYLCLFGGARSGDVVSARWDNINLEQGTWFVPEPKNAKPYTVVLHPETIQSLKARPRTSEWVFPSFGVNGHRHTPKVAFRAFLKRAGIVGLTPHDLRRSLGSWQAANNESLAIIGKSLGHSSTAATAIYSRLGLQPVRRAVVSAVDAMLATQKKPLEVVPTPSRRRKVS
jgi:integrase